MERTTKYFLFDGAVKPLKYQVFSESGFQNGLLISSLFSSDHFTDFLMLDPVSLLLAESLAAAGFKGRPHGGSRTVSGQSKNGLQWAKIGI